MIGLIIILVFPFAFFYTQINKLDDKTNAIKKAINKEKETYLDTVDMCTRWTTTGEKVYRCKWVYTHIKTKDAVEGDDVLIGLNSYRIYRNYSKENFLNHIQNQINNNKCWCYERSAYNKNSNKDYILRYNMKDKYFYYLGWDNETHNYIIIYYGTNKKEIITYERYKELGGYDSKDKTRGYKK